MREKRNVKCRRQSVTKISSHPICPTPWFPIDLVQSIHQVEPRGMWRYQEDQHSSWESLASRYLHRGVVSIGAEKNQEGNPISKEGNDITNRGHTKTQFRRSNVWIELTKPPEYNYRWKGEVKWVGLEHRNGVTWERRPRLTGNLHYPPSHPSHI